MNAKLTKALRVVLDVAETRCCSELHHIESHRHSGAQDCPVEAEIKNAASLIRGYMLKGKE